MSYAITGPRKFRDIDKKPLRYFFMLFSESMKEIKVGGAKGIDTYILSLALEYNKNNDKKIYISVYLPDTLEQQPKSTWAITRQADEIIELRNKITKEDNYLSYRIRNKEMIKKTIGLLAFWNGSVRSGTYMSMNEYSKYYHDSSNKIFIFPLIRSNNSYLTLGATKSRFESIYRRISIVYYDRSKKVLKKI
ncbi:MAG: hypothetical protein GF317_05860 [Candidatus Lokiarchaeota archaeon]|nr:hypothetical protein [Candidatus Lokiarchaeota archaeon]